VASTLALYTTLLPQIETAKGIFVSHKSESSTLVSTCLVPVVMDLDAARAFVNENAHLHSSYNEKLKEAGGIRKVNMGNGTSAKVNMLTYVKSFVSCASCGTFAAKMSMCAGCGTVHYCSRECQKSNWKQHKNRCRKFKKAGGVAEINQSNGTDVRRWLLNQPDIVKNLAKASAEMKLAGELPVVLITKGENHRRSVLTYGGMGSKKGVEKLKQTFPMFKDIFREYEVEPSLHPVIAIVDDDKYQMVLRLRVC